MSDTPETDAATGEWAEGQFWQSSRGTTVQADFARRLERDRDETRWQLAEVTRRRDAAVAESKARLKLIRDMNLARDECAVVFKSLRSQVAVLREALDMLSTAVSGAAFATPFQKSLVQPHYDAARSALNSTAETK